VHPEGLGKLTKIISSDIEPATFRFDIATLNSVRLSTVCLLQDRNVTFTTVYLQSPGFRLRDMPLEDVDSQITYKVFKYFHKATSMCNGPLISYFRISLLFVCTMLQAGR
jgi:hypothetical protein